MIMPISVIQTWADAAEGEIIVSDGRGLSFRGKIEFRPGAKDRVTGKPVPQGNLAARVKSFTDTLALAEAEIRRRP